MSRGHVLALRMLLFSVAVLVLAALPLGAAQVLRFGLPANPDSLDPHKSSGLLTFQILKNVYDTLVEPDQYGALQPALATSWTVSASQLEWRFILRRGVLFHNGNEMTARDVRVTFMRIINPATASRYRTDFSSLLDVEVIDRYTVLFHLREPQGRFLASLATGMSAIMPADLIEAGHDFSTKPVGTGPFKCVEWLRDYRILLERNPDYWMRGRPLLDTVDFRIIPEQSIRLQAMLTGQLDICPVASVDDMNVLEKNDHLVVQRLDSSALLMLAFNCKRSMLESQDIRRAISHAIDKRGILDAVFGGGQVTGTFADPGEFGTADMVANWPFDPSMARRILNAQPQTQVRGLELLLPDSMETWLRAGQLVQAMMTRAGFAVNIRLVDWSTWLRRVFQEADYDLTLYQQPLGLDPNTRLSGMGQEGHFSRWVDAETDELVRKAARLSMYTQRYALYRAVMKRIADALPMLSIGVPRHAIVYQQGIQGFHVQRQLETWDLRQTRFGGQP